MRFSTALTALAALAAGGLGAQTPGALEEIIVTAEFRQRSLQELPLSVTVLDAEALELATVQHFEEATQLVPNLNWAGGVSRPRYFQIRGIGERSQYEGAPNPSVGFVLDDIDFSAIGGIATTFDMERAEVLRGPQGTRYGANALAGLIYLKSNEPTEDFDAHAELTTGSDGTWALGSAFGGPLRESGGLSYRFVLHQYESNGFRDNVFLDRDDTYGRDELTARAKLHWEPSDRWQADFTLLNVDLDNGYDAWAIDNGFTTYSDRPGRDAQHSQAVAANVRGDVHDAFELVSITGVAASDIVFSFDADWGNPELWAPFIYDYFSYTGRQRDTVNQEVRLISTPQGRLFGDRASWVVGLYALRLEEANRRREFFDDPADGVGALVMYESVDSNYEATNAALFGELELDLSAATTLMFGVRSERRRADYLDTTGEMFSPSDRMWGGQLAVSHDVGDTTNVYASISRGYKAGGFNLGFAGRDDVGNEQLLFDPEFLWNLELGVKGSWLDGRLIADALLFWSAREDVQIGTSAQLDPDNPATFIFFTDNAGEGSNAGIETSATWRLSDSLTLRGSLGLLEAEIEEFGANEALAGRDQAHAPSYTFSLGGVWRGSNGWFGRLDVSGRDAFFYSDSHDQKSDAYALTNVTVGRNFGPWAISAWVRNVFDERYTVRGFFFGNEPPDFPPTLYTRLGDPRHYGLTIRYRL